MLQSYVRNVRVVRAYFDAGPDSALPEVAGDEAAVVLQSYVRNVRVVRAYFDAGPDSALPEFAAERRRHPVFRLRSTRAA